MTRDVELMTVDELRDEVLVLRERVAAVESDTTVLDIANLLSLTATEIAVFALLYARIGKIVSKAALVNWVYADSVNGGSPFTIKAYVSRLRKKLAATPWAIETAWGVGFRMVQR